MSLDKLFTHDITQFDEDQIESLNMMYERIGMEKMYRDIMEILESRMSPVDSIVIEVRKKMMSKIKEFKSRESESRFNSGLNEVLVKRYKESENVYIKFVV